MSKFIRQLRDFRWLIFGTLIVFVSVTLLLHFEPKSLFWKVILVGIGELGFAFVIAYIFSQTVERRAKEEYNQYVSEKEAILSKNIFDYIYSIKVDKAVFEFIEGNIYQKPFFRTGMEIDYEFCGQENGWVQLRVEYSFSVRNISTELQPYDLIYDLELPLGGQPPKFDKGGVYRVVLGDRDMGINEIQEADSKEEDTVQFKKYKFSTEIPSNEEISVVIGSYMTKREIDAELWRSSLTSDGLKVKIRFDSKKFDVRLISVHPNPVALTTREDDHQMTAVISEPLMPKNGIYFWWAPKSGGEESDNHSTI